MTTINLERTLDEWAAGWSTQDIERVVSLCTDECLYEDVPLGVVNHGRDELRAFGQQVFNAFPDFKIELTTHIAAGDWAMLEWTMSGTHKATSRACQPPTNRSRCVEQPPSNSTTGGSAATATTGTWPPYSRNSSSCPHRRKSRPDPAITSQEPSRHCGRDISSVARIGRGSLPVED